MAAPVYTPPDPTAARHDATALPSMKLAATPRIARRLVWVVVVGVILLPAALAFVPWQQTVHGTGMANAFDPSERTQFVVAPIEGRVKQWHVVEGQKVKANDLLVEMLDNDPFLLERLEDEAVAIGAQVAFASNRVNEIENRISNLRAVLNAQLIIARQTISQQSLNVQAARQNELAMQETRDLAKITYDRDEKQFQHVDQVTGKRAPLVSEQQRDNSKAAYEISVKRYDAAVKAREAAEAQLAGLEEQPRQIEKMMEAQINGERVAQASASESLKGFERAKLAIDTRISRQRNQNVYAPTDGTIFRILANGEAGGQLVRPGERLATIVPDIDHGPDRDRRIAQQVGSTLGLLASSVATPAPLAPQFAVDLSPPRTILSLTRQDYPGIVAELFIDGNDLPLVQVGDKAVLQFEGWAAVQFVAFPEAAAGTFEGRVYLVDPTANEKGDFRILVQPDPDPAARPWPAQDLLRQGVRAQGWVLMPNKVTMGWEVWRQLNGFPPYRPPEGKKEEAGTIGPVPRRKSK